MYRLMTVLWGDTEYTWGRSRGNIPYCRRNRLLARHSTSQLWLSRFVVEARRKDRKQYPLSAIQNSWQAFTATPRTRLRRFESRLVCRVNGCYPDSSLESNLDSNPHHKVGWPRFNLDYKYENHRVNSTVGVYPVKPGVHMVLCQANTPRPRIGENNVYKTCSWQYFQYMVA